MLAAAAHAVAGLVDASVPGAPLLPPVETLRETSVVVAAAVVQAACADGVATVSRQADIPEYVRTLMLHAVYRPVRPVRPG